jgi:glycosyltransferase involved in cell wall biosynthesis
MISVFTMAFNEEVLLQFMIDHYRSRFPGCEIYVYDNESTDRTAEIALANNCHVIPYLTNGQVDDKKLTEHKNSCWKQSKTDWVLVCDVDELLDINQSDLINEETLGTTIIKSEGYNMVNMEDNFDLAEITHGARCLPYDKSYLFNKRLIKEINYAPGGHNCSPIGNIAYSNKAYLLYHYNGINIEYHVQRHILTGQRMSEVNRSNGWGNQYLISPEQKRQAMLHARTYATKVKL